MIENSRLPALRAPRLVAALLAFCLSRAAAQSAPPELPPETPPAIVRDMRVIQNYRAEVERRTGVSQTAAAPGNASGSSGGGDSGGGGAAGETPMFAPLVVAPPRTSITPDAPAGTRPGAPERDPFEVSPQLRESGPRNSRVGGMQEGMVLNLNLRLKAMVRGPEGGMAQVQSSNGIFTVYEGDELEVNGIRYTVHIERDGLLLRGAGAPQYKMRVR
ncbi:MAG: hypothetical protein LBB76_00940 [Azoarcus sp.]|jgi:hypothetical protein|nr:hypothetical protein [Azoarcus sp.]